MRRRMAHEGEGSGDQGGATGVSVARRGIPTGRSPYLTLDRQSPEGCDDDQKEYQHQEQQDNVCIEEYPVLERLAAAQETPSHRACETGAEHLAQLPGQEDSKPDRPEQADDKNHWTKESRQQGPPPPATPLAGDGASTPADRRGGS